MRRNKKNVMPVPAFKLQMEKESNRVALHRYKDGRMHLFVAGVWIGVSKEDLRHLSDMLGIAGHLMSCDPFVLGE